MAFKHNLLSLFTLPSVELLRQSSESFTLIIPLSSCPSFWFWLRRRITLSFSIIILLSYFLLHQISPKVFHKISCLWEIYIKVNALYFHCEAWNFIFCENFNVWVDLRGESFLLFKLMIFHWILWDWKPYFKAYEINGL